MHARRGGGVRGARGSGAAATAATACAAGAVYSRSASCSTRSNAVNVAARAACLASSTGSHGNGKQARTNSSSTWPPSTPDMPTGSKTRHRCGAVRKSQPAWLSAKVANHCEIGVVTGDSAAHTYVPLRRGPRNDRRADESRVSKQRCREAAKPSQRGGNPVTRARCVASWPRMRAS